MSRGLSPMTSNGVPGCISRRERRWDILAFADDARHTGHMHSEVSAPLKTTHRQREVLAVVEEAAKRNAQLLLETASSPDIDARALVRPEAGGDDPAPSG